MVADWATREPVCYRSAAAVLSGLCLINTMVVLLVGGGKLYERGSALPGDVGSGSFWRLCTAFVMYGFDEVLVRRNAPGD